MEDTATIKQHLPTNLIVLLDSLANVEFHKLTKKLLKDRIEEIKIAVAKELVKRSRANGEIREQPANPRPNSYSNNVVDAPNNNESHKQRSTVNEKTVERTSEKSKNVAPSRSSSSATNAKSSTLGLKSGINPQPPTFNDLLQMANKKKDHQTPDRYSSQRSLSPMPHKSNTEPMRSSTLSSRAHSPHSTSQQINKARPRPVDTYPGKSNGLSRSNGISKNNNSSSTNSNKYNDDHRTSSTKNGHGPDPRRERQSREDAGNYSKDPRKDHDDEPSSDNRKEPTKSAKVRRRNEEERLLELKKQRLREEAERIKLRNEVLAGRNNRANDLKTLVTKSQGSTVLSCGRSQTNSDSRSEQRGSIPRVKESRNIPDRREIRDNRERDVHRERRLPSTNAIDPDPRRLHRNPYMDPYYSRPPYDPRSRRYNDYDDEEDDEDMDDFIDDQDEEDDRPDVSSHIREIFGYDKRRYIDMDDDDIEEASYAQIEKEERKSARLGRLEDAEDIRMEQEHKKLKRQRLMSRR